MSQHLMAFKQSGSEFQQGCFFSKNRLLKFLELDLYSILITHNMLIL